MLVAFFFCCSASIKFGYTALMAAFVWCGIYVFSVFTFCPTEWDLQVHPPHQLTSAFASVHFSLHRFFLRLGERHIQQPTAGLWWFCPTDKWSLLSFFPFSFVLQVPAPLFTAQWLRRVPYVQYLHFYKIAIDLKNKHNKSTMQLCPQLKLAQGAEGYICASCCHLSALPQWEVLFNKTTLCGEKQESSKIPSSPQFSLVHRQ